ncbi:MAG: hypothetical protein ACRD43_14360 [Pyrinomonadaceae bacterium]
MRLAVGSSRWTVSLRLGVFCCLLLTVACQLSIPNLESPECADTREAVRGFYSFHYANDIAMSPDNLKLREKYLTPELYQMLMANRPVLDYFTNSDTPLKAFKVAACKIVAPDKAEIGVHLFWKPNDSTTIQKEIDVDVVKQGDKWLINKVTPQ